MSDEKIEIENVNSPGNTSRVNRQKYEAMRKALLQVLPAKPPGLKVPDAKTALLTRLPAALFPGGDTAGWWLKAVQLDLEAKGIIAREAKAPVRLYLLKRQAKAAAQASKSPVDRKQSNKSVKTIDEYLANVAPEKRAALQLLRSQIKGAAPGAEECISYGQPAFRKGRVVCGFGATEKHCALYMFSGTTLDAYADKLTAFDISKGTLRFRSQKPPPAALVKKLVKARLSECAALDVAKKVKK